MAGSGKAKKRFILRRTGAAAPASTAPSLQQHLGSVTGVTVVDASPRMLLVDAAPAVLEQAMEAFRDWEVIPETFTPLPDARVKAGRS